MSRYEITRSSGVSAYISAHYRSTWSLVCLQQTPFIGKSFFRNGKRIIHRLGPYLGCTCPGGRLGSLSLKNSCDRIAVDSLCLKCGGQHRSQSPHLNRIKSVFAYPCRKSPRKCPGRTLWRARSTFLRGLSYALSR